MENKIMGARTVLSQTAQAQLTVYKIGEGEMVEISNREGEFVAMPVEEWMQIIVDYVGFIGGGELLQAMEDKLREIGARKNAN